LTDFIALTAYDCPEQDNIALTTYDCPEEVKLHTLILIEFIYYNITVGIANVLKGL
jgi:hypothetical protein